MMDAYKLSLVSIGPDWNTFDPKGSEQQQGVLVENRDLCQARGGQLVAAHGIVQCRELQRLD